MSEPTNEAPKSWTVVVALTVFIAILIATALNFEETREWLCVYKQNESCVRHLVYDFQTLISGIIALAAAGITVATMQGVAADDRRRHRQLLRLALRNDYLKVERLIIPQLSELESAVSFLERFETAIDPMTYQGGQVLHQAASEAIRTKQILGRPCWDDAKSLFDASMTKTLREFQADLARLVTVSDTFRAGTAGRAVMARMRNPDGVPEMTAKDIETLINAKTILGSVRADGGMLLRQLAKLREHYLEGELQGLDNIQVALNEE